MTETLAHPVAQPERAARRSVGWWLRYTLGLLLLFFFAFAGAVAIGLAIGPVSLGPLAPLLLDSVSSKVGTYRLTASDALLSWSSEQSRFLIRFVGAKIVDEDDVEIAAANDIGVSFSLSALIEGEVAPRSLEINGPTATFLRHADGSFDIGLRTETRKDRKLETANADIGPFIEALLEPPQRGRYNTYLTEVTLSDATITFIDEATASIVKAPGGTLTVKRTSNGLSATLDGQVSLPGGNWRFYGKAYYDRGAPFITVSAGLEDARLGSLADAGPLFDDFRGADAPLTGSVDLTVTTKGEVLWAGMEVTAGAGLVQMPLLSNVPIDLKSALIDASYDQIGDVLSLNSLTIDSPALSGVLKGGFRLKRGADRNVTGWDASLNLSKGQVKVTQLFENGAVIDSLDLDASDDLATDTITLRRAELHSNGALVSLAGQIRGVAAGAIGATIQGRLSNLPLAQMNTIWPKGVGVGARDWITENVFAGTIATGTIDVNATPEQLAMARPPDSVATIVLNFEGAEIAYMSEMPHLTDVAGQAIVRGNSFTATIEHAAGGNLKMTDGTVGIPDLVTKGEPARIGARIDGLAADLLTLLDHQPLGYPSRFGLDPKSVKGEIGVDLKMIVPTWKNLDVDQIGIDVKAHLTHAGIPLARDIALSNGTADFAVTGNGLSAKGAGNVAGVAATFQWDENFKPPPGATSTRFSVEAVIGEDLRTRLGVDPGPYVDGDAAVQFSMTGNGFLPVTASTRVDLKEAALSIPELGYTKKIGQPAIMTAELARVPDGYRAYPVRLEGAGIDADLDIGLSANGALRSVSVKHLTAGRNDVAFSVDLAGAQPQVVADVAVIDLDTLINALTDPEVTVAQGETPPVVPPKASTPPNVRMRIKAKRVLLRDGAEAQDLTFNVDLDHGILEELLLKARIGRGSVDAGLWPQPDGRRRVVFRSDDMGMVIHGATGFASLAGGTGQLDLMFPRRGQPGDPSGVFAMADFRLTEQPFLVRLLGAGSFQGLIDLLNGDGILFTRLDGQIALNGQRIEVRNLLMTGPSAGATGDGYVDRDTDRIAARGTLAPIYSLNSLLGDVPGLGKLLGGDQGILAITFAIEGDVDDLSLDVSPLSFLAPGIIRRLFEFDSPLPPYPDAPPPAVN